MARDKLTVDVLLGAGEVNGLNTTDLLVTGSNGGTGSDSSTESAASYRVSGTLLKSRSSQLAAGSTQRLGESS